jgi:dipeptidase D
VDLNGKCLGISVTGLKGGHSGLEIIKQRGNAIKLLGRVLNRLNGELKIRLVSVKGGATHNAIPREAYAVVSLSEKKYPRALEILQEMEAAFKNEYKVEDKAVKVEGTAAEATRMMSVKASNHIIRYILTVPDGVQSMSKDLPGLVESSLNLGVLEEKNGKLQFVHAVRSSIKSLKDEMGEIISALGILTSGELEITADYPEWAYEANSKVRATAIETYKKLYGKEPQIKAIHAGLECGFLKEKLPETDMLSFGPNLYDVHTPEEHVSISSVERTWEFIKALLGNLK